MLGCLLGCLFYNYRCSFRRYAAIFMGDCGSTFLGYFCAFSAILLSQQHVGLAREAGSHYVAPVVFLWVLALPIFDMAGAMVRRIVHKQSPLAPDRGHLHHVLQRAGLSVQISTPILFVLSFLFGLVGVGGFFLGLSEVTLLLLFLVCWFLYAILVTLVNERSSN